MKSTLLKYAGLALGVCLALPSVAAPLDTTGLRLDKVVLVMRHGIRPATDTAELQRWSARTWPAFGTRDGQLTEHGRAATVLLGQWQRHTLDSLGLFKAGQCPQAGDAYVWSSPVARTQATSAALVKGMFPGCNIAVHHGRESEDRLFHGGENGLAPLDPARTQAAMLAAMGGSVERSSQALCRAVAGHAAIGRRADELREKDLCLEQATLGAEREGRRHQAQRTVERGRGHERNLPHAIRRRLATGPGGVWRRAHRCRRIALDGLAFGQIRAEQSRTLHRPAGCFAIARTNPPGSATDIRGQPAG
ncbi:hypothetical protein ALO46_05183 [Pseudomonas syringae pv. solidagae]|nr:hypothetical protein ALO46_05183 [Pseudomonas syringae pv. solidagae]